MTKEQLIALEIVTIMQAESTFAEDYPDKNDIDYEIEEAKLESWIDGYKAAIKDVIGNLN